MELVQVKTPAIDDEKVIKVSSDNFIQANTQTIGLSELKEKCIIPAFAKDNEPTISHHDFVETVNDSIKQHFKDENILFPAIRVSHPIKGRIPEAKNKPANLLEEHEKTLYYERMGFLVEIPSIKNTINNNQISLSIGGVRALNHQNLYSKKTVEKFKVFIGFKVSVCTNLCISTDGYIDELEVWTMEDIVSKTIEMFNRFDINKQLNSFKYLCDYSLDEKRFAQLVGKAKLYQYLPKSRKDKIQPIPLVENQISTIAKEYYRNEHFGIFNSNRINLWQLYNLFTAANKSSYIDTFTGRGVASLQFINLLKDNITNNTCWYFN